MFKKKQYQYSQTLSQLAWKRLKKNKFAVFGMVIIAFAIIVALMGYTITPDSTPYSNNQILEIATKPPGFKVKQLFVMKNQPLENVGFIEKLLIGKKNNYTPIPIKSYAFIDDEVEVVLYCNEPECVRKERFKLADILFPIEFSETVVKGKSIEFKNIEGGKQKITVDEARAKIERENIVTKIYYFGTDRYGRDMLSRMMIGTRVSISVGLISVIISIFIGIGLGTISGFYRGKTDYVIMWIINVVWSIPTLLLVIAITLALGKGFWQVFVAVGLTMWVDVARVVRGQVLSVREKEYIEATKALGFSDFRTITKHILPNIMGPVIVIAAAQFASAILIEAGLSFLGLGSQPPIPSWGIMIKDHYGYIIADKAYLAIIPGLAIMFMVLAFTLLGNGLRDALDSRAID